jgi:hypothetical protein
MSSLDLISFAANENHVKFRSTLNEMLYSRLSEAIKEKTKDMVSEIFETEKVSVWFPKSTRFYKKSDSFTLMTNIFADAEFAIHQAYRSAMLLEATAKLSDTKIIIFDLPMDGIADDRKIKLFEKIVGQSKVKLTFNCDIGTLMDLVLNIEQLIQCAMPFSALISVLFLEKIGAIILRDL